MNLADMADFVCGKVRQTDAASVAKCKSYLSRRYGMIYNQELWKDSLWAYDFTFNTAGALGAAENDDSIGNVFAALRGAWLFPSAVDKVVALRAADTRIPVTSEQEFYKQDLDAYALTGPATNFLQMPRICCYSDVISDVSDDSTTVTFENAADNALAAQVVVRYIDHWGEIKTGSLGVLFAEVFLTVTKPVSTGALVFSNTDSNVIYLTMDAGLEALPLRCRIRFSPRPTVNTSFKALVKLKAQGLDADAAEPQISGIEDCLMAFVQGDMLQRARQYGKAQIVTQEAMALLGQLKTAGVAQEAHDQRITPEIFEPSGTNTEWIGKGWW